MVAIGRIIAFLAVASSFGCNSYPLPIGTWKGVRKLSVTAGTDPVVQSTLARVELTIKANGRFDLFDHGLPMSGSVQTNGKALTLYVDSIMNRPASRTTGAPSPFTVRTISTTDLELSDLTPVILKKEPQPDDK